MGESPLFKRTLRGSIQIVGGLGVGLLVAVLLVAWRLGTGPVSIGFLTPYIDQALDDIHQGAFDITFDDTILTWAGWERTLDIRVVNLQAKLPSGELVASIPEVSISLSAQALMQGTVAPRSIEFFGPSLKVVRQADGQFAMGLADAREGSKDLITSMILVMLQDADPSRAMSYLQRINMVAGEVTFEDHALGTTWHAPSANASFTRIDGGLKAELDMNLQVGGKLAAVSVLGDYSLEGKRVDLGVSFEDVTPAAFAGLSEQVGLLGALDLPVSGTITMSVEQNGRIEGFGFDVNGRDGHVALPVPVAARIGALDWAQRLPVAELGLSGRYDGARGILDISRLAIAAKPRQTIYLPAPIDHALPLSRLETTARFIEDEGRLEVSGLGLDAGGPRLGVDAIVTNLADDGASGGISADITATAENVPFDDLARYWPKGLGVNAREWVMGGLSSGIGDRASITVALRPEEGGGTRLASMAGQIHAQGVTVDYLPPMAKVTGASATANFTDKRFDITVEGGDGPDGLKATGGVIELFDLDQDLPRAIIRLEVEGPVKAALQVVDSEPLGFASDLGIDPRTTAGEARAQIELGFPLKEDMATTDVRATAHAQLHDAEVKGAMFSRDLTAGALTIDVTGEELKVAGDVVLGGVPVRMNWKHDFRPGALFLDRYDLSGYIEDVLNLDAMGVQVPEILSRYMRGGVQANVDLTRFSDGRSALSARVDLANIALSAPELGWNKPAGVPAAGVLEFRLLNDVPREIPKFAVDAPDMDISGSATFSADGALERIDIDTMRTGLTDAAGSLTPRGGNLWELVLRGESFDARNLWDEFMGITETPPVPASESGASGGDFLAVNAAIDVHTVVMHKNRVIEDLIGTVYRRNDLWSKIDVVGIGGGGAPIEVLLDTDNKGLRYLSIQSDDAGAALESLDLYDNMLGGRLDLKAAYTSARKDASLEGVAKITDFAMIDAPAFTKLIGIMSLTGVLDALQGEGLNFEIAEAPFTLKSGVLELTQARASGPTIGVTASGQVDMDNRVLDLKGTVVPAYAINALLGKIPVIGELFTGSEKGGGLFAATYTMKGKGDNVDITVNPLSALAPGALRDIFTGSDKEKEIPK